jgi:hypothetical protein
MQLNSPQLENYLGLQFRGHMVLPNRSLTGQAFPLPDRCVVIVTLRISQQ